MVGPSANVEDRERYTGPCIRLGEGRNLSEAKAICVTKQNTRP